jgi:hypothetical protein
MKRIMSTLRHLSAIVCCYAHEEATRVKLYSSFWKSAHNKLKCIRPSCCYLNILLARISTMALIQVTIPLGTGVNNYFYNQHGYHVSIMSGSDIMKHSIVKHLDRFKLSHSMPIDFDY